MRVLIGVAFALSFAGGAWADGPQDGPSEPVLDRVAPSVVHVLTSGCPDGTRAASGFVWAGHGVVTDLHVVAGCHDIRVGFQGVDEFPATVLHVDKDADLVLLRVPGAPPVAGLEPAGRAPEVGEHLDVFGYPLGVPRRDTMPVSVSYATKESPRLTDGLSPQAREQLQAQGFPDLDTQVLHVDGGNLLPGHSGAPLIDWQGKVLGIGSGGLASGSAGIGWAVRAKYLEALPQAATTVPTVGSEAAASFAYVMPNRGAEDTVQCGELTLYRVRQATLGDIARTNDDPDRIEGLADQIGGVSSDLLRSRKATIWIEKRSGAAVVVPEDAVLQAGQPFCRVTTAAANVFMAIRLVPMPMEYGTVAWDADKDRLQGEAFRLIERLTGSGMRFRGHGLVSGVHMVNGAEVERRLGEAAPPDGRQVRLYRADMAGRGAMVLAAAIDRDFRQNNTDAARLAWAESVLAVHLSSFPPRVGEAAQQGQAPPARTYLRVRCGDGWLSPLGPAAAIPGSPAGAVAWTSPHWSFRIYLPDGVTPRTDGEDCVAEAKDSGVHYLLRLTGVREHADAGPIRDAEAQRFRGRLAGLAGVALEALPAGGPPTRLRAAGARDAEPVAIMADLRAFRVPNNIQALVGAVRTGRAGPEFAEAVRDVGAASVPAR